MSFCKSIFRKFNLGYKEDAFCCKNCKRNILKNIQFRVISTKWKNKHDIYDPLINRLVSHIPKDKNYISFSQLRSVQII